MGMLVMQAMLDAAENDISNRFAGTPCTIRAAHTCPEEEAALWKHEIEERFPGHTVLLDPLTLSIACHIGPGALAIAITPRLAETGTIETCSSN